MPYTSGYKQAVKAGSPSDAKGLEKTIINAGINVQNISLKVNTIFYGKSELVDARNTKKRMKNPLDMGIIPLLDILTSVDACELVNYALDKSRSVGKGATFNPNKRPTDTFGIVKWTFQKMAFDVQTQIDGFYNEVGDVSTLNISNGAKTLNVITDIKNTFAVFTQAFSNEQNPDRFASINPDIVTLLEAFPQLRNIGNYINDSLSYFDKYSDFRQLQNADIQKAVNSINKIRQYCVLIQSLNNPAAVALAFAQAPITSELDRLLKDVDVQKLIPTLKKANETLKQILSVMNSLRSVIDTSRAMIRVFLNLIYGFKVVIRLLKTFPAPNQFTTVGVTTTAADALKKIEEKGPNTFEVRLSQISTLLSTVSLFLNTTLPIINEIIQKITALIASIERCKDGENLLPTDILNEIKNTTKDIQSSANDLQAFLDNKKQNDLTKSSSTQIGEFTINIIEEQVVEETFSLRRRYGVALNRNGIIQVQSQPTFASDDNVIINEVKLLLQQNNVITTDTGAYTPSELDIINDASAYLANSNINMDIGSIEDSTEVSSEIRGFVTQTKRGRILYRLSRRAINRQRRRINERLNANRRQ
jgi:hypothetical protein